MTVSVINIFMVFTNQSTPFSVFNISSSSSLNINDIISSLQKNDPSASNSAFGNATTAPKLDILPPEVLNKTLNLSTHFFLMSFILGFGYKLANLGTQLIRPINVRLKSHFLEVMKNGIKESPSTSPVPPQSVQSSEPVQPIQPPQV